MNWNRKFLTLALVLALSAGVSCTTADNTAPDESASQALQASQSLGSVLGGVVGGVDQVVGGTVNVVGGVLEDLTGLLTCSEQKYDVGEATIGPKGGTIKVGKNLLEIPQGALSRNVKIKAEQIRGSTNSIRFSPEGLRFEKPATLTIDYKNCQQRDVKKTIVYTSEGLKILEARPSLDLLKKNSISAPIDHFSRYAVAW
jgi:hypothetical protein